MRTRTSPRLSQRRQRGAIAATAALWMFVAVAALGAIDVGHMLFVKRDLQRVADMAALAGVQQIAGSCGAAQTAAGNAAVANGFSTGEGGNTLTVNCGRWESAATPNFSPDAVPPDSSRVDNAVSVTASTEVPYFFVGKSRLIESGSVAQATNIDVFTLGTGIADIDSTQSALLNSILGGLLHTQVQLGVGDYQQLVGARLSVQDLMTQLNVGTVQGLLNLNTSYQNLALAMVRALQTAGDSASANLLGQLAVAIPGDQQFNVGATGDSPGLLALGLADQQAALSAMLDPLDVLLVSAQLAQRSPDGKADDAPVIQVNTGVSLPGVLNSTLSLKILEPPALAIGEAGTLPDGTPRTTARSAVIDASLQLSSGVLAGLSSALNLAPLASIQVLNTPIVLSLTAAQATADLANIDCAATAQDSQVTINVKPSIATLCLGTDGNCSGPINVANVVVLGLTVAKISIGGEAPGGGLLLELAPDSSLSGDEGTPLTFTGVAGSDDTRSVNSNAVGSDLDTFTSELLKALPNALQLQVLPQVINSLPLGIPALVNSLLNGLFQPLLAAVGNLLQPVFQLLDTVLVPVLGALGVQIGTATVHNVGLTCGAARLVSSGSSS